MNDNVELTVGNDGAVTDGHGRPFAKFTPDDALVLKHFPRTFRLLGDGQVVAENSDGSNRVFLGAKVDPPSPAVRRAALLEVAFFVNLSPALRTLATKGN